MWNLRQFLMKFVFPAGESQTILSTPQPPANPEPVCGTHLDKIAGLKEMGREIFYVVFYDF